MLNSKPEPKQSQPEAPSPAAYLGPWTRLALARRVLGCLLRVRFRLSGQLFLQGLAGVYVTTCTHDVNHSQNLFLPDLDRGPMVFGPELSSEQFKLHGLRKYQLGLMGFVGSGCSVERQTQDSRLG